MAAPFSISITILTILLVGMPTSMGREAPGEEWKHVIVNRPMLEAIRNFIPANSEGFLGEKAKYFFISSVDQSTKKKYEYSFLKDFDPWLDLSIYHGDSLEAKQDKPVEEYKEPRPEAAIVLRN